MTTIATLVTVEPSKMEKEFIPEEEEEEMTFYSDDSSDETSKSE